MSTPKSTHEIRESFQAFFESKGHTRVSSARLVPEKDPTLLFVNAGMVPFKDCFLGLDKREYTRATSAQKCVRAGGKHNDLENVGFTARHHTFFEMLGNFSFGDYFKEEAIAFAWEYVTQVLGLPKERLAVSVFKDDEEAAKIWNKKMGVPENKIFRFGEAENFWAMGDTGPCGPCSEIFWDQGREVDGERWLEFWNCVFMQFDRQPDGTLVPLKKPCVDTGMGLERMAAVLQGVGTNYDTDLLSNLIKVTKNYCETKISKAILDKDQSWEQSALRVIVDHLRSTSFLIADGVLPSNEGRGYVLRRILRRAVRFGKQLGLTGPFLNELYPELKNSMGLVYPELIERESVVREVLKQEEEKFFETLEHGLHLLENSFKNITNSTIGADVAFKLYDTFGFPLDLTELIAREKNLKVDTQGFEKLLQEQQTRSRASWKGSGAGQMPAQVREWKSKGLKNNFIGYESYESKAQVLALHKEANFSWVLVDPNPFYGEGGGQVGDQGFLELENLQKLRVIDCQKPYEGAWVLQVEDPAGLIKVGTKVKVQVDNLLRARTRSNHTATHLLHAALRRKLGDHVQQAGSVVDSTRLRFDFSHPKPLTELELKEIENDVNEKIQRAETLDIQNLPIAEAKKLGAMALFGEKYGDIVRVVKIGNEKDIHSLEFCGGLHVQNTGEIIELKIISENGVAAGTRRIEAVTGPGVAKYYKLELDKSLSNEQRLMEQLKLQQKEIEKLKGQIARGDSGSQVYEAIYKGTPLKFHLLSEADPNILRQKCDHLRQTDNTKAHVLWCSPNIMIGADPAVLSNFHSGNFLRELVKAFGGKGGGQDRSAQGAIELPVAGIKAVLDWLRS